MRVSPVGWAFDTLEEVLKEAKRSALPSHGHAEGILGAQAIAAMAFGTQTVPAVDKIVGEGKSLLPIGMTAVEGDFSRGDVIAVRDQRGTEVARGLANYASTEARLLCRKASADFERLLGYAAEPEMIHRDNLVLSRS